MEPRSSRRFAAPPGVEPSSLFASPRPGMVSSPKRPHARGGSTASGTRSCSFITLLQFCLALLCGSFVVQWWYWQARPLLSRDPLAATAHAAAAAAQDGDHAKLRGGLAAPATTLNFGDLEALTDADRRTEDAPQPAPPERAPLPAAAAVTLQPEVAATAEQAKKARVFVPPGSAASPDEVAAWRARFDPARHTPDQRKVAEMVAWAWKGYEENAFGQDFLNVHTMKGDGLPGHDMAITLVDSLDTLFLLGMFDAFDRASAWIAENMKERIYQRGFISVFETTIRNMGGLLSAYYLSGQPHLLQAAKDLGDALSPVFKLHAHGIPGKDFDVVAKSARESASVAEAGSLQLEFKYLAAATGERKYFDQVERIMDSLFREVAEKYHDGLLPVQLSSYSGRVVKSKITLGAYGDSYYEYLLKQWLLSGKRDAKYRAEYVRAVDGIRARLVAKSHPSKLVFIGEIVHNEFSPKMDHLVCFVPGMLALGYLHGMPADHLELAKELLETCYQMYAQMDAKLAPEIAYFSTKGFEREDLHIHPQDAFNLQRPETVESLVILYRVTKDEKYREYGRAIRDAFERHCKLPGGGYTTIGNVKDGPVQTKFRDGMESFFLAETLKYLFLLFSDDETLLPLDEIVFNTEAHPFPMAYA